METLILIVKLIIYGVVIGLATPLIALIVVSVYAFLLNLFTDDKEY